MTTPSQPTGKARVAEIFRILQVANPTPTSELAYTNSFQLLVAVVLSAQMTDKGVNKATDPLFSTIQTPQQMIQLTEEGLQTYLKSINYFRAKSRNVLALSQQLVDRFGGQIPTTREDLESLPGVGRKTANVLLNTLYGQPTMAVDTHVYRVARRLGLSRGTTPRAVEDDLLRKIPTEYKKDAHHWLILHGRYTCTARNPQCLTCPLNNLCLWKSKILEPN